MIYSKEEGRMHELVFYEDIKGKSEVLDYIEYLSKRSKEEKDSRILYCKIVAYLNMLEEYGTRLPKKSRNTYKMIYGNFDH